MKQFSEEYIQHIKSEAWRRKSREIRAMTDNRCILFPWLRAKESHHLTYDNLKSEMGIRDAVPLSVIGHSIAGCWLFRQTILRVPFNWFLRLLMVGWLGGGVGWIGIAIVFVLVR